MERIWRVNGCWDGVPRLVRIRCIHRNMLLTKPALTRGRMSIAHSPPQHAHVHTALTHMHTKLRTHCEHACVPRMCIIHACMCTHTCVLITVVCSTCVCAQEVSSSIPHTTSSSASGRSMQGRCRASVSRRASPKVAFLVAADSLGKGARSGARRMWGRPTARGDPTMQGIWCSSR